MDVETSPRRVFITLLSVIGVLLVANLLTVVAKYVYDHDTVFGLVRLFNFNQERNIPTLFSTVQLLLASGLLAIIGTRNKAKGLQWIPWLALAAIFLLLAIDENAQIHEEFTARFRDTLNFEGLRFVAWIIPYGTAVLVIVALFARFLYQLPNESSRRFIVAGAIFVFGAIGIEYLGARHAAFYGSGNLVFALYTTCEELFEMFGIAYFVYGIMMHIVGEFHHLRGTIKG